MVDFGRKTGFTPKKVVLVDFGHKEWFWLYLGPQRNMGPQTGFAGSTFSMRSKFGRRAFLPDWPPRPGNSTFPAFVGPFPGRPNFQMCVQRVYPNFHATCGDSTSTFCTFPCQMNTVWAHQSFGLCSRTALRSTQSDRQGAPERCEVGQCFVHRSSVTK